MKKRVRFFKVLIDPLTMEQTLARVEEAIAEQCITQHMGVNVAKLVMAQKDKELERIINSCGLISTDGQGILWGAKLFGISIPERVTGIDLFVNLVKRSSEKGFRPYFFGATKDVVEKVVEKFQRQYPDLKIAGYRNGYFDEREESGIAEAIGNSRADMLFVAMETPKKEIFLNQYRDSMQVPFIMGVGGSFDVIAGKTKRAPAWMQRWGLEWFYRFLCEPRRMWRRYLITNGIYFGMIMRALVTGAREASREEPEGDVRSGTDEALKVME